MKKVVFLRSNPIAPDPRVEKEAETLTKAGYDVTIVGWDRFGDMQKTEQTSFGKIERVSLKASFGRGIANLPYLLKWQWALVKWLMRHDYDIIHSCDFDTVLPAFLVSKFKKAAVVYDIYDFYADMLRNTPEWIKKLIKMVDYYVINHVEAVVIVDDARKHQISGTTPKLLEVIYNSPTDNYLSVPDKKRQSNNQLLIAYIGLLQVERGLFEMIEVVSEHPEWKLNIAGFGGDEELIRKEAAKCRNVTFQGRVDYKTAIEMSSEADVLFAIYDPSIPNHKYSSPNKLFEAMMLGKPIIVSDDSSMADIVRKIKNGIVVRYGDKKELESALKRLQEDNRLLQKYSQNSRRAYDEEYGWVEMERRLLKLYSKMDSYLRA